MLTAEDTSDLSGSEQAIDGLAVDVQDRSFGRQRRAAKALAGRCGDRQGLKRSLTKGHGTVHVSREGGVFPSLDHHVEVNHGRQEGLTVDPELCSELLEGVGLWSVALLGVADRRHRAFARGLVVVPIPVELQRIPEGLVVEGKELAVLERSSPTLTRP